MSRTEKRRLAAYKKAVKNFLKESYKIYLERQNRGTSHVANYDKFQAAEARQFYAEQQLHKREEALGLSIFEIDKIWSDIDEEITN